MLTKNAKKYFKNIFLHKIDGINFKFDMKEKTILVFWHVLDNSLSIWEILFK